MWYLLTPAVRCCVFCFFVALHIKTWVTSLSLHLEPLTGSSRWIPGNAEICPQFNHKSKKPPKCVVGVVCKLDPLVSLHGSLKQQLFSLGNYSTTVDASEIRRSPVVRGSPPHTLWSHKYSQAQFCLIFSTQSHPRTQTGVTCAHSHFPESPAHTDWSHILHHFFDPESPAHTSHGIGWGGVGMMTFFCTCTRVQSAAQWTASVHTSHMSKPVM